VKQNAENLVEKLFDIDDELFEMANLHPKTTGLRQVVWFSGDPVAKHHRPRGKVRVGDAFYPFSIDEPVEWLARAAPGMSAGDFTRLVSYVRLNRQVILDYWNGDIDTHGFIAGLQRLE
jgi:hypothetical protein